MRCIYSHEGGAYCDKRDHGAVTVGCYGEENCPDLEVLTNADRIRQMSDEELARYYAKRIGRCYGCEAVTEDDCFECQMDWLKAPVEGE